MGPSEDILKARRILFLGAGSSKPLGKKLMGEFIDALLKGDYGVDELVRRICAKQKDLEFLLEELEGIASKDYLKSEEQVQTSMGILPAVPQWPGVNDLVERSKRLIPWVKREVFYHYRDVVLPLGWQRSFQRFIETVAPGEKVVVTFTTNYDPAIEEFARLSEGWKLVDGFVNDERGAEYYWSRDAFDLFTIDEKHKGKALVLFKLHGSTTWVQQTKRIVKVWPVFAGSDPAVQNVLIYPATRKVAIEDPYFTAYDYLERCLASAESCVVVGYSFRDYDCLTRFKAAKVANPKLRVVLLDPWADKISEEIGRAGVGAEPFPLLFPLGENQYSHLAELVK